jgi:hypothetical protein
MDEPMSGGIGQMTKMVTRIIDENTYVFERHDLAIGGDNTKVFEIEYVRR